MIKRKMHFILALLCLLLILAVVSCGIKSWFGSYPKNRDHVIFVSQSDGTLCIEYLNSIYFPGISTFYAEDCDIHIGWNGPIWGYQNHFYAPREENPPYIFEERLDRMYFHKDYDYQSDLFIIDGTESEIVFSDAFVRNGEFTTSFDTYIIKATVILRSKTYPNLKLKLDIIYHNGGLYGSDSTMNMYILSDGFIRILDDNKIL